MRREKLKRRSGMTMVELLGVMVVIAILASIAIGGVTSAQSRARDTSAMQALNGYKDAFTTVCVMNPGIIADRGNNWTDSTTYTSENGLKKVVTKMNELLDDELAMHWDVTQKCYVSMGQDPWGGNYILTEYPMDPAGSVNYYDPTAGGKGIMALAVWCTGNSDFVSDGVITKDTRGVAMSYIGGLINTVPQGIDKANNLEGWVLKFQ